jgi:hypothetical protein
VFTIVSGDQCVTARAPYLSDAERRGWLAALPDRPQEQGTLLPKSPVEHRKVSPGALSGIEYPTVGMAELASAPFAEPEQPDSEVQVNLSITDLPFSSGEIAVIAARIGRGETKTEVVRKMPGYATRRHREFVAYYEALHTVLASAGLVESRMTNPSLW